MRKMLKALLSTSIAFGFECFFAGAAFAVPGAHKIILDKDSRPFHLIPAGVFKMGSAVEEDAPEHSVTLSAFFIGETEVTYGEWKGVSGWGKANGYDLESAASGDGTKKNVPVIDQDWDNVVKWCNAKSEKEGATPCYAVNGATYRTGLSNGRVTCNWNSHGYRLPTEAEWEKAARGGLIGRPYPNGFKLKKSEANYGYLGKGEKPVRSYAPNGYGLYDMAGNVREWCWDFYGPYTGDSTDPRGHDPGEEEWQHVLRGGAFSGPYPAEECRVSNRHSDYPRSSSWPSTFGFRLVRGDLPESFPSAGQPVVTGAVLTVSTQGAAPLSYQWLRNGVPVSSGTTAALSLAGLTSGKYSVRVKNSFGTSTSVGRDVSDFMPLVPAAASLIAGGTYTIGNVIGDSDITDNPVREVILSAYYMAVNDITKAQWDTVRSWGGSNGYTDLVYGEGKASNHPVRDVSWYDVVKWANAASEKDGLTPCYTVGEAVYRTGNNADVKCDWAVNGYRLPTEAEWEVAARGGLTGGRFPWGDTISQNQAN